MKKGFTLIELLAVIVILAIISLIATPMILGVVEKAKKGAVENSTLGYIDAVEKYSMIGMIDNPNNDLTLKEGIYDYNATEIVNVELKGEKPREGWVQINDKGNVEKACLKFNSYNKYVKYENNKAVANQDSLCTKPSTIKYTKYDDGTAVYFNPETGKKCSEYETTKSNTGVKTGCMKWYTYNDTDISSTVKMILDHNTTAVVAYNSTGTNTSMKELATALTNDTSTWQGSLNPSIITANEVTKITGNTTFNQATATGRLYYFDTNTATESATCKVGNVTGCKYGWLNDKTSSCTGCQNAETSLTIAGYWTSTPVAGSLNTAWNVDRLSFVGAPLVNRDPIYGLRPVITVSKNLIK